MRYELLKEGDITKEGDLKFNHELGIWKFAEVGWIVLEESAVLLPLPDKPKMRLEELAGAFSTGYYSVPGSQEHDILVRLGLKSLCAHLNIELEEPKPEWEAAFDLEFNRVKLYPSHPDYKLTRETFQKAFEAGQKSKETK